MKKRTIVFWLGILVIITPFLGVPIQWKEYGLIVIGVLIVLLSLSFSRRGKNQFLRTDNAYVENRSSITDRPE